MNIYKNSLNLPKTKFSMKANLITKEPLILKKWKENKIYEKIQEKTKKNKSFYLHDGPPYANGNIHLGHAVNKILKDIILKYKRLSGFHTPYIPFWDCHGLPIEHQIEKIIGKKSKDIDLEIFHKKCKKYVIEQIKKQKEDFIKLGVFADWENYQSTMSYESKKNTINTLAKCIKKGYLYRDLRPVYWCLNCQSSLADAEIEYLKKKSISIYINFKIKNPQKIEILSKIKWELEKIYFIVYTTTPWTLPTCQAVSIKKDLLYQIVKIENNYFIVLKKLHNKVFKNIQHKKITIIITITGIQLNGIHLLEPLFNKTIPLIFSNHVTEDNGTGVVHMSPDHGLDDYISCKEYNIHPKNIIDKYGYYSIPEQPILNKINIINSEKIIIDILIKNKKLFFLKNITHSYPHCWRHKEPIIFRTTPQWFIKVKNKDFQKKVIKRINKVSWFPEWGKKKMEKMFKNRPNWCISRQRIWGIPIPLFIHKKTNKLHPKTYEILKNISKKITINESYTWWKLDSKNIIGKDYKIYKKVTDVIDVWFESGSIHQLNIYKYNQKSKRNNVADLYLEGSDQYRGWFMSSTIISMLINKKIPFKNIVTHGFVVDSKGKKMSKSLNNSIQPNIIIKKWGADILRLWVAYTKYSNDLSISEVVLKQISEIYRRIRNTIRFLLSNIFDFSINENSINYNNLLPIDKWILSKTYKLQKKIIKYYSKYNFHDIIKKIVQFCSIDLGSNYLEIVKDRQYTMNSKSIARRSSQTIFYHILQALSRWISPILSFTADEIWDFLPNNSEKSIFFTRWYSNLIPLSTKEKLGHKFWKKIFFIKKEVNKFIENKIENKYIKNSLEASIELYLNKYFLYEFLYIKSELIFIFSVSEVNVQHYKKSPKNTEKLLPHTKCTISIKKKIGQKCHRCWFFKKELLNFREYKNICTRCKENISGTGETRIFV